MLRKLKNITEAKLRYKTIYLAFAGSDPDDPANLAVPILQGQMKS